MQFKKISFACGLALLAWVLAGCSPAGPRAFFRGQEALQHGDSAEAVARFKQASSLMPTNAVVWDYYGMALEADQQPQAAASAYQRALDLDRDLMEAHFNLGNLWLEQNQPDAARAEFTAYTLRRDNDPDGWLKLGSADLRVGETLSAEKCFSKALYLRPSDPAAYNGLGLARIQRDMPHDAVRFFDAAIHSNPGYAPAILNLATVNQKYLHDNAAALEQYRAYLALNPQPPQWEQVNALVNQLEHQPESAPRPAPAETSNEIPPRPAERPTVGAVVHPPRHEAQVVSSPTESAPVAPREASDSFRPVAPAAGSAPVSTWVPAQVVQVAAPPEIVASPRAAANLPRTQVPVGDDTGNGSPEPSVPVSSHSSGFWQHLFHDNNSSSKSAYLENGVTPLPGAGQDSSGVTRQEQVPLSNFPRYAFQHPSRPAPGQHQNGTPAAAAFLHARLYEQDANWTQALLYYSQAAAADPSWFLAQYETAFMAQRLRIYSQALAAYENALVIEPGSVDARYNFALALRSAGYIPDAIHEFEKILAAHPDHVGAHLALGNIQAQNLHDPQAARPHYLKVLELDPNNPQASNIRFWLAANPQ